MMHSAVFRVVPRLGALKLYAGLLALVTIGLAMALVHGGVHLGGPPWAIALLAGIAVWAERQHVRITANTEMTVSVLPVLFAAVVYGPLAAMIVGAIGLSGDFKSPYTRWAIWASIRSLAGGLAGLAALMALSTSPSFGQLLLGVTAAALTDAIVDACLGSMTVALRGSGSSLEFLRSLKPILLITVPFYAPVLALLVYAYQEVSPWSVVLFFAPAFAAQASYRLYREEREASEQLKQANVRLERANLSFASALVAALDARDRYTAGHSAAVAVYARDIAARLGLSEAEQQLAHLSGLLHDIGKVGLPPGILEKPGALTLQERRQMEEHSVIGERILANVEDYAEIARIVRHHHERFDGNGYPDGICGPDIPLISRIIAVSDAYNAMTSGRPYRDAMPSAVARLRLAQAVEAQFDTTVVAAFEAILAAAGETYRSGASADFALEAQKHSSLWQAASSAA
jgi:putative nucleotidyltransferase with HDIG domain